MHLSRLKEQMKLQQQLYERLEAIAAHLQALETVSIEVASRGAMDSALMEYMSKARAALNQPK